MVEKEKKRHTFILDGTTCSNTEVGSTKTILSLLEHKNVKTEKVSQHLYQSCLGSKILNGLRHMQQTLSFETLKVGKNT